jgi:citronellol/citronellal dehydrogenase
MLAQTMNVVSHMDWSNGVVFVTGASRGIGAAFGKMDASRGARVILASRSVDAPSHDGLSGSLMDVKNDIDRLGGSAHIMHLDTRDDARISAVANEIVARWGRLDLLVNNASAIDLRQLPPVKVADLAHSVNTRGTMLLKQAFLPALKESDGQILTISPPLEDCRALHRHTLPRNME